MLDLGNSPIKRSDLYEDIKTIVDEKAWLRHKSLGPPLWDFPDDGVEREERNVRSGKWGKYWGEWRVDTNVPHGKGVKVWATDGRMYWGHFMNGVPNHFGWLVAGSGPNEGNEYEGFWVDGFFHGKGWFSWNDGWSYNGEWNWSMMNGIGEFKWPDGGRYIGDWV